MGFIEKEEYCSFGSKKTRFVGLIYFPNGKQELICGELPKTTGQSYFYTREQLKREFGDKMGFDILEENPEMNYRTLVKLTAALDEKLGGMQP